jgi:uncharacterized protein (DUF1330 family)
MPMPAYVVVNLTVHDPVPYETYRQLAPPTITAHGGRYLVRGGKVDVKEGDWSPSRLVILEFPDVASAQAWWGSEGYAGPKALRQSCADAQLVIVEGI